MNKYQPKKKLNHAHLNIRKSAKIKEAQQKMAKDEAAAWVAQAQLRLLTKCAILFTNYKEPYADLWSFITQEGVFTAANLKDKAVGMVLEVAIRRGENFKTTNEIKLKADEYYQVLFPPEAAKTINEGTIIQTD